VRWLVAVYDGQPVPVEVAGVRAGKVTYGHRLLSPGPVEVDAQTYLERLRERYVLADPQERRGAVLRQAEAIAARGDGRLLARPELVDEVAGLVESPAALGGRFPEAFLAPPRAVTIAP